MNGIRRQGIEILAPAGSWDSLSAAMRAGADSVYFGIGALNLRARSAANFTEKDLRKIRRLCSKAGVRAYLALNSIIYDEEQSEVERFCKIASDEGIDAIIAMDFAAIEAARRHGIPVHASVQNNISNLAAVRHFAKFADAVVLARELSLGQIQRIHEKIRDEKIKGPGGELVCLEIFVHGALCLAISGKCYLSLDAHSHSANRGDCFQNCRRSYLLRDDESGNEFTLEGRNILSPKDLCTIRIIGRILDSGASILKIEGRGRSADYVYECVSAYKEAVDLHLGGRLTGEDLVRLEKRLASVFNRGFWHGGHYLNEDASAWSGGSESLSEFRKEHVGFVSNFFGKISVAELNLNADSVRKGEILLVAGSLTGAERFVAEELVIDGTSVPEARKGQIATVKSPVKLRRNDKVYRLRPR